MFETWNLRTHLIALLWLLLQPWIVEVLHIRSITPFRSTQYFIHLEVLSTPYFTSHPLNGLIKLCNILSRILTLDALWSPLSFNKLFCNGISFNFKFMQVDSHLVGWSNVTAALILRHFEVLESPNSELSTFCFCIDWIEIETHYFEAFDQNLPYFWGAVA